jgi:hypothetical protein
MTSLTMMPAVLPCGYEISPRGIPGVSCGLHLADAAFTFAVALIACHSLRRRIRGKLPLEVFPGHPVRGSAAALLQELPLDALGELSYLRSSERLLPWHGDNLDVILRGEYPPDLLEFPQDTQEDLIGAGIHLGLLFQA